MLAELVEVVIGVDTHKHTHTAAVVAAATAPCWPSARSLRTRLATPTYSNSPHSTPECGRGRWKAQGGYGAGLAAHLAKHQELVVELDRPDRPARWAGAKSDPIDAVRAACDALARTHLAQPRTGSKRAALQVLLTTRQAAVQAAADGQRQLHALVVTAPEQVRARFRGLSTRAMLATAQRLRPAHYAAQVHVFTAMNTLKAIARRVRALENEAAEHEKAIRAIVTSWCPDLLNLTGVGPIVAATVLAAWSTPGAAATTPPSPCSPAPPPSPPPRARQCVTGSTAPETASSTAPSTPSS